MSKSHPSAGQPGTSHGSVEVTGQEPPRAPVSLEALTGLMHRITSHALTMRELLDVAADAEDEQLTATLVGANAVASQIGALADAALRSLGSPGCYSDALLWIVPEMRQQLRGLVDSAAELTRVPS